jgi:hypothetical protein
MEQGDPSNAFRKGSSALAMQAVRTGGIGRYLESRISSRFEKMPRWRCSSSLISKPLITEASKTTRMNIMKHDTPHDTRKRTVGKNGSGSKPDGAKRLASSSSEEGGSGVGAVGGAAAGAVLGAVAGPVGAAVGLVAGAVAGVLAGKRVARGASPAAARTTAKSVPSTSPSTAKSYASDSAAGAEAEAKTKKSTRGKSNFAKKLGSADGARHRSRDSQPSSAPKRQAHPAGTIAKRKNRSRPVAGH